MENVFINVPFIVGADETAHVLEKVFIIHRARIYTTGASSANKPQGLTPPIVAPLACFYPSEDSQIGQIGCRGSKREEFTDSGKLMQALAQV
jgi:hypothetical protein